MVLAAVLLAILLSRALTESASRCSVYISPVPVALSRKTVISEIEDDLYRFSDAGVEKRCLGEFKAVGYMNNYSNDCF